MRIITKQKKVFELLEEMGVNLKLDCFFDVYNIKGIGIKLVNANQKEYKGESVELLLRLLNDDVAVNGLGMEIFSNETSLELNGITYEFEKYFVRLI